MRRPNPMLLVALVLWGAAVDGARAGGLPPLPRDERPLSAFVPRGWRLEDQAAADLNRDGVADLAAVLVQDEQACPAAETCERQRALIVLLGRGLQRFVLGAVNDALLACKGCGGVKEGVALGIDKGVLVVEQSSGSREYSDQTWRFRHDAASGRFWLIGIDTVSGDGMQGTGTRESLNLLTGQKLVERFRHTASGERRITLSSRHETAAAQPVALEAVQP